MALLQISEPGMSAAPHQHRLAVGIDLGTTNSLVATVRSGSAACLPDKETVERIGFVKVEIKGDFAVFHCGVGEHLAGDGKADGIEQGLVAGVVFAEPPLQGRGLNLRRRFWQDCARGR